MLLELRCSSGEEMLLRLVEFARLFRTLILPAARATSIYAATAAAAAAAVDASDAPHDTLRDYTPMVSFRVY